MTDHQGPRTLLLRYRSPLLRQSRRPQKAYERATSKHHSLYSIVKVDGRYYESFVIKMLSASRGPAPRRSRDTAYAFTYVST